MILVSLGYEPHVSFQKYYINLFESVLEIVFSNNCQMCLRRRGGNTYTNNDLHPSDEMMSSTKRKRYGLYIVLFHLCGLIFGCQKFNIYIIIFSLESCDTGLNLMHLRNPQMCSQMRMKFV